MFRFGIYSPEQYLRRGEQRRFSGSLVSYKLLNLPEDPSPEQIRIFEDISFTLQTSNGTFRTTFRHRFKDVDAAANRILLQFHSPEETLQVQDRAISHGLTSLEWAQALLTAFPRIHFVGSDILLYLIELVYDSGETYIVEPNGKPLQYIKPPLVLSLGAPESWKYPVNRFLAGKYRRQFEQLRLASGWMETNGGPGYQVRKIPFVHPEARAFSRAHPDALEFRSQSVFDPTPSERCDALRTMNIFNTSYFSRDQLLQGVSAVYHSLNDKGLWIVGRTLEEDFSNHVTFLQKTGSGWNLLERLGKGSEIESLAQGWRP